MRMSFGERMYIEKKKTLKQNFKKSVLEIFHHILFFIVFSFVCYFQVMPHVIAHHLHKHREKAHLWKHWMEMHERVESEHAYSVRRGPSDGILKLNFQVFVLLFRSNFFNFLFTVFQNFVFRNPI